MKWYLETLMRIKKGIKQVFRTDGFVFGRNILFNLTLSLENLEIVNSAV